MRAAAGPRRAVTRGYVRPAGRPRLAAGGRGEPLAALGAGPTRGRENAAGSPEEGVATKGMATKGRVGLAEGMRPFRTGS